ncbi:MAG TPA: tandem-95 repeat protein, partial [Candidatus Omnitrophota bacterium]|nr:tandem-95 repeat protein [Candidatus Omnitrophota bacterium]
MLDERNPNTTTRPAGADEARQDLDDLTVLGKIGDTNLGEPRLNLARGGEADESKLGSLATIHQGSRGAPEVTDMTGLMTGGGVAVATDVAVEGGRVARTEVAGLETGGGDGGEVTGSAEMRSQTVEPTRTAWTPEFFAASGESRPSGGVAAADAPLFAASMIGGEGGGSAPAMVMPSEDNPVMAVLPEPTLEPDTEDEEEDEPIVTDDDVNAAPVVIGVTGGVGVEDHEVTGAVLASDADGDRLTYAIAEDGAPLHGSLVLGLDGAYTYLPAPDWSGTDAFTVIVSDGHGGTVTRTVTVEVAADNDVPVVTGIVGGSGLEDHVVTGRVVVADVDGDGLSYALAEGGAPAHGTVAFAADGSYAYVPAEDWSGGDSFTVTVADGHGGSVTRTIAVTVAPVADTPELAAGAGAGTMADDHDDLGAPTSDTIVLGHGGP